MLGLCILKTMTAQARTVFYTSGSQECAQSDFNNECETALVKDVLRPLVLIADQAYSSRPELVVTSAICCRYAPVLLF